MGEDDWVTLPRSEYERLRRQLDHAERYLRDRPTLVQEFEDLRRRVETAEGLRDAALAEAARLRSAATQRAGSISGLAQVRLVGQLLDALLERFTPVGADIQLHRCRICGLTSVEAPTPSILDHYYFCPARLVLHDWIAAEGHSGD